MVEANEILKNKLKMINDYKSFLESLLNPIKKQSCRYFYSARFRNILNAMVESGNKAASFLSYIENTNDREDDITFIDITDNDDSVSFIQVNRLCRIKDLDPKSNDIDFKAWANELWRDTRESLDSKAWHEQRSTISIGRFLNKITTKLSFFITDKEKEDFVNNYKSRFKMNKNAHERFELVQGEAIIKWYNENSYEMNKGQLSNSCMRYERCSEYFDIYVKNPDVCKLLILHGEDNNKIIGRALIWKLHSPENKIYMDRVYTNIESDKNLFNDYFDAKKWDLRHGRDGFRTMEVKLKPHQNYDQFPYMDTFLAYSPIYSMLSNEESNLVTSKWWELRETNGEYRNGNTVFSAWYDEYIERDNAVFCDDIDDWLYSDDATYLEYIDRWVSPNTETCYCIDDCDYLSSDCVYSNFLKSHIYSEDSIEISTLNGPDYAPKDYLDNGNVREVTINNEIITCLTSDIIYDPFKNRWLFKTDDNIKSITNKINVNPASDKKFYDYLKSIELTEPIIKQIRESLSLYIKQKFDISQIFAISKFIIWMGGSNEHIKDIVDENSEKVSGLGIEDPDSIPLFAKSCAEFCEVFVHDIVKDKEMLKIYLAKKFK